MPYAPAMAQAMATDTNYPRRQSATPSRFQRLGKLKAELDDLGFERDLSTESWKMSLQGSDESSIRGFQEGARHQRTQDLFWQHMERQGMENELERQEFIGSNRGEFDQQATGIDWFGMKSNKQRRMANARAFRTPTDTESLAMRGSANANYRTVPIKAFGKNGEPLTFHAKEGQQGNFYNRLHQEGYTFDKPYNPETARPNDKDPAYQAVIDDALEAARKGADPGAIVARLEEVIGRDFDPRLVQAASQEFNYQMDVRSTMAEVSAGKYDMNAGIMSLGQKYGPSKARDLRLQIFGTGKVEVDELTKMLELIPRQTE